MRGETVRRIWLFAIGYMALFPGASAQNCDLLKQTFAIADTISPDTSELYIFRFSPSQLQSLMTFPALKDAAEHIEKLQKTLEEDHESYVKGILWQLDTKLANRQLLELKQKCGEIPFLVFQREIDFYRRRYIPKSSR